MAKLRKIARPTRSGRPVPKGSIAEAALLPHKEPETVVAKANAEELTKAIRQATEVFGDEEAAFRRLGMPVAALDYATPISCLAAHQGAMRVKDILTQIDHGVW